MNKTNTAEVPTVYWWSFGGGSCNFSQIPVTPGGGDMSSRSDFTYNEENDKFEYFH